MNEYCYIFVQMIIVTSEQAEGGNRKDQEGEAKEIGSKILNGREENKPRMNECKNKRRRG